MAPVLFYLTVLCTLTCLGPGQGSQLKYVWGDAMEDPLASGPNGEAYPWDLVSKIATKQRSSRSMLFPAAGAGPDPQLLQNLISPQQTRQLLLNTFGLGPDNDNYLQYSMFDTDADGYGESENSHSHTNKSTSTTTADGQGHGQKGNHRQGRAGLWRRSDRRRSAKVQNPQHWRKQQRQDFGEGCVPSRLCASTYNTTAPLYGISLTSGKPVTIVQKFPDLLQQVVFQVCKQTECEVLQGECIQTYLPYLFLVLPLGPVTLTGQDYVLVESGCVCQPKYARKLDPPSAPLPSIQPIN